MTLSWSKFVSKFSRRGRHISQRGSDNKGDLYIYQIRYIFCYKFSTRQKHKLQYRLNVSSHTQYQDYRRHTKRNTVQCALAGYYNMQLAREFLLNLYTKLEILNQPGMRKNVSKVGCICLHLLWQHGHLVIQRPLDRATMLETPLDT